MATTQHFLVIQTTDKTQESKSNRKVNLKAKVAASIAILGCAAALAFGGLRAANPAQDQPTTSAATSQVPAMQLPNNSYADLIWELENSFPATSAPQQASQLSGGSYADLIWELEAAASRADRQPAQLSGGSYADTIWELENAAP